MTVEELIRTSAHKRLKREVARVIAAVCLSIAAFIVGKAVGLPFWDSNAWVSDNAALVLMTFIGVMALTHRD